MNAPAAELRRSLREVLGLLPTPRLALLIAGTAPVWLLTLVVPGGGEWVSTLLLVLAFTVLADILTLPLDWQLTVTRRVAENVGIGDEVDGEYEIQSRFRRALRYALFDALPRGVDRVGPGPGVGTIAAHGVHAIGFRITGRERGRWPLGPIVIRVAGRLGLVQRTFRLAPEDAVLVTPSMAGVRRYRLLTLQHRLRDAGVRAIRRRGEGTNFTSLREYVTGDDPRRIDWKATARREKLITRDYTVEQGQTVIIAVDAGRLMTQLAGNVSRFEHALSSATLLADIATQNGDQVGAILFDDQVRAFVPAARGRQAVQRLRDAFIPARATMTEPDYAAAFRMLAARHRKRSLIVLYTDVIDPRASQSLIALTARSAMRHALLVVALRNDALMAAAVPMAASGSDQLYESAAAEELVMAREEALVRMRHAGVTVLDVSPRLMTAAVVNRYLDIKARGSL